MGAGPDAEALRARSYAVILTLACLAETAVALLDTLHPGPPSPLAWESTFGALFCAVLLAALLSRRVSLRTLDLLALVTASVVLVIQLAQSFLHDGPIPARLYLIGLLVIVCAVTNLSLRYALVWTGTILAAFTGLVLTRPSSTDATLLLEMVVMVVLVFQLAVFGREVARERARRQEYHALALTDPLTGAQNRRAMYAHLDRALGAPGAGQPFAVVLLDLDHFKAINDRHGHDVGDRVLRRAAELLEGALRPGDHLARWGGEEFLVLLAGVDEDRAQEVTEHLWRTLRNAREEGLPRFTASFGVAVARPGDTVGSVVGRADAHLYQAKAQGRDCWCPATPAAVQVH